MKANIRRSLSLLILTGLVLQTVACNGGTTPPSESTSEADSETTSEAENEFPTLPEDLRFDGETIHILYRQLPRPHRRGISRLQSAVVELFRDEGNVA